MKSLMYLRAEIIVAEWHHMASWICVIIGSDNGLLPIRRQAITSTNDVIWVIGPLGTYFNGIWIKISFWLKMLWKCGFQNVDDSKQASIS